MSLAEGQRPPCIGQAVGVTIRQSRSDEAGPIHALLLAAFLPFRTQYTKASFDATVLDAHRVAQRMQEGPVFVAEVAGKLVGTVGVVRDARGVYIRGMAVHPDARRMGRGRRLLEACEEFAREQDAPCLWLSTTPFLTGSIALYEAFGFRPAPGPTDLFGTPLVSYEKRLNGSPRG